MTHTTRELPRERWSTYQTAAAIRQRRQQNAAFEMQRRERAWRLARAAAEVLYENFGAARVTVFGSLANNNQFTQWSDIDLVAWGIPPDRFYAAVAAVTALSADIKIDLVDPDNCPLSLQEVIEREGVLL
jgi:uncharacterized protein